MLVRKLQLFSTSLIREAHFCTPSTLWQLLPKNHNEGFLFPFNANAAFGQMIPTDPTSHQGCGNRAPHLFKACGKLCAFQITLLDSCALAVLASVLLGAFSTEHQSSVHSGHRSTSVIKGIDIWGVPYRSCMFRFLGRSVSIWIDQHRNMDAQTS